MVKITLDLNKNLEGNAEVYYNKAKKIKKKLQGAKEALDRSLKEYKKLKLRKAKEEGVSEAKEKIKERKKEWYEKFRWFISSEGFLVIGGRDSTSNEIVIKKHTDKNDLVLHTDMAGSPFFVIKSENKKITEKTIKEAADATCSFSKAWRLGLITTSVFYVEPEQVSKKAQSGEYLTKGAFMIYGKTNYAENKINLAIGMKEEKIMSGPIEAVKKNCEKFVEVKQGRKKTSDIAKKIQKKIGGDLDEIIRALPAGGCEINK
ncbi:DUF814 domain-containing protein [Candidatus Woesearchaeota archaeon]|nr:DUF814 domain-containing protein [Candidatus Woesearchaeota archaeon]